MRGNVKASYSKFFIKSGRFAIQMNENKDVGRSLIREQTLAQPHQLRLGNSRDTSNWSEYRGRYFSVHAHKRGGFRSTNGFAPAKSKRGDIHSQFPQGSAHLANHPRLVAVP